MNLDSFAAAMGIPVYREASCTEPGQPCIDELLGARKGSPPCAKTANFATNRVTTRNRSPISISPAATTNGC